MASSSLSVFSVSTPKGTYSPGEIVSGHVAIVFNAKDLSVKGLWIDFNAYCEMGGLRQEEESKKKLSFFHQRLPILGEGIQMLNTGRHEFPFMFVLPRSLPPTLRVKDGTQICHRLQAVLDNPWGSEASEETFFQMLSDQDINVIPKTLDPIHIQDTKTFGSCSWCQNGPLTVSAQVPKTGFVHGERIPVHIKVENDSHSSFEVRLRLIHEVHSGSKTLVETEVVTNESIGLVDNGVKVQKLVELVVPFGYPVSFVGKYNHIDLVYYLLIEGKFIQEKTFSRQLAKSEVIIGDIPHEQTKHYDYDDIEFNIL